MVKGPDVQDEGGDTPALCVLEFLGREVVEVKEGR